MLMIFISTEQTVAPGLGVWDFTEIWELVQPLDMQEKHRKWSEVWEGGRGGNYNQAKSTLILPCILFVKK